MTMSTVEEAEKAVETFNQFVSAVSFLISVIYCTISGHHLFGLYIELLLQLE